MKKKIFNPSISGSQKFLIYCGFRFGVSNLLVMESSEKFLAENLPEEFLRFLINIVSER